MNRLLRVPFLALLLTACASSPPPETAEPASPLPARLEVQNRTALTAFEKGRFQQAADLYGQALETATAMDDSAAIVDALYNRAVSLMLAENYGDAAQAIRSAEGELARAGRSAPPELTLLAATLAYRTGDDARAWELTEILVGPTRSTNTQVIERAWFLRGLLAERAGDADALNNAISALQQSRDTDTRADRLELEGYRAEASGNPEAAIASLDAASRNRDEIADYRGKSRTLVAAAEVLEVQGRKQEAANRYLRAGRSAASRGSIREARAWLERAEELATETGATDTAAEARRQLEGIEAGG